MKNKSFITETKPCIIRLLISPILKQKQRSNSQLQQSQVGIEIE